MQDFFKAAGEGGSEGEAFVKWRKSKRERDVGKGKSCMALFDPRIPLAGRVGSDSGDSGI